MSLDILKNLGNKAKALEEPRSVPVTDLLTPSFVSSCSSFKDAQELFDESGFKIDNPDDFAAIPDEAWDEYISKKTSYSSWSDMLGAAGVAWTKRQLGL